VRHTVPHANACAITVASHSLRYFKAAGLNPKDYDLPGIKLQLENIELTFESLEHFLDGLCKKASNQKHYYELLTKLRQSLETSTLAATREESFWQSDSFDAPVSLTRGVRDAAQRVSPFKASQVFDEMWRKTTEEEGEAYTIEACSSSILESAMRGFEKACQDLLDPSVSIHSVHKFLGDANIDAQREMQMMFKHEYQVPGGPSDSVKEFEKKLSWFAKREATREEAKSVQGVAENFEIEVQSKTALEYAESLLDLYGDGKWSNADGSMQMLAECSNLLDRTLTSYKTVRQVLYQLGEERTGQFFEFLLDSDENIGRLLAESMDASLQKNIVKSLQRINPVLRPLLGYQEGRQLHLDASTRQHDKKAKSDATGLFEQINDMLIGNNVDAQDFANLLIECCENLTGLKRCYQAIAAKEEQTKETIGAIVQGGTWSFKVISSQSAALLCDFKVNIELSEDERVLPSATLLDYRSRALLYINSRQDGEEASTKEKEEAEEQSRMMRSFVDLLECANTISEGVSKLCALGHFSARNFGTERDDAQRSAKTLDELKMLRETVEGVSHAWQEALRTARLENYILSFFCSTQLGALCDMAALAVGDEDSAARDLMRFVPAPTDDRSLAGMGDGRLDVNLSFGKDDADINRLAALGQVLRQVFVAKEVGKKEEGKKEEGTKKRALSFQRKKQRGKQRGVSSGEMCLYFVKPKGVRSLILEGMMSLYAAEGVLPHRCQLLFCQPQTSNEEIDAFCHRAFYAQSSPLTKDRLFCLVQIDQLSEQSYLHLVRGCLAANPAAAPLIAALPRWRPMLCHTRAGGPAATPSPDGANARVSHRNPLRRQHRLPSGRRAHHQRPFRVPGRHQAAQRERHARRDSACAQRVQGARRDQRAARVRQNRADPQACARSAARTTHAAHHRSGDARGSRPEDLGGQAARGLRAAHQRARRDAVARERPEHHAL
jgi:hypothetical protein